MGLGDYSRRRRFERLARPELDALYRTARRLVGDAAEAQDIVQDAILKAYVGFDEANEPRQFRAWLSRILVNVAFDHLRSRRSRGVNAAVDGAVGAIADPGLAAAPQRLAEVRETGLAIDRALAGLTPELRAVLVLVLVEETPYADAAAALGISVDLVRSRLGRARAQLRHALRDMVEPHGDTRPSTMSHARLEFKRGSK